VRLEKRLFFVERGPVSIQDRKILFLEVSFVKQKRSKRKSKRNHFDLRDRPVLEPAFDNDFGLEVEPRTTNRTGNVTVLGGKSSA
jgi:hypothetical protein